MSDYQDIARHPRTNQVEKVWMLDDYFGRWSYGIKFGDGKIFPVDQVQRVPATELFDTVAEMRSMGHFTRSEIADLHQMVKFYNENQSFNTDPKDFHEANCRMLEEHLEDGAEGGDMVK